MKEYNFHIDVVNTKESIERKEFTSKLLTEIGINFTIHSYERHKNPIQGVINSHIETLRKIRDRGNDIGFILEDNVILSRKFYDNDGKIEKQKVYDYLMKMKELFDKYEECELVNCCLIISPGVFTTKIEENVYSPNVLFGASFYAIPKKTYTKIINEYDSKEITKEYDIYLSKYKTYTIVPFLFRHRIVDSIANKIAQYGRNLYFTDTYYSFIENSLAEGTTDLMWSFLFLLFFIVVFGIIGMSLMIDNSLKKRIKVF